MEPGVSSESAPDGGSYSRYKGDITCRNYTVATMKEMAIATDAAGDTVYCGKEADISMI